MVDNDEIKDIDEKFVGQFLINGTVRQPIESMMIPTASIKELTENTNFHWTRFNTLSIPPRSVSAVNTSIK